MRTVHSTRDLGVLIDDTLKWQDQCAKMVTKATTLSYVILRSFSTNNISSCIKAYKVYIRPLLEFNTVTWNSCNLGDKRHIEKVQQLFTRKLMQRANMKYNSYADRLLQLNIESLELRRLQFDLITVYKILNNHIDITVEQFFVPLRTTYNLRHHKFALKKPTVANSNVLQNSFKYRVIDAWNSLPSTLVSCEYLSAFKTELHKVPLQRFLKLKLA